MITLTEKQAESLGRSIVDTFGLRKAKGYTDRYQTEWGTKTVLGVGLTVLRLVDEAVNSHD